MIVQFQRGGVRAVVAILCGALLGAVVQPEQGRCAAAAAPLGGEATGVAAEGAGEDDLDRALAILDEMEVTILSVEYREEPLGRVIDDLDERLTVSIRADWDAMDRLGVTRRDPITLRITGAPVGTVLAAVALQLGDEFERPTIEVHAGQVLLTTLQATESMALTAVYDVRDLLAGDTEGMALDRVRAVIERGVRGERGEAAEGDEVEEATGEKSGEAPNGAGAVPSGAPLGPSGGASGEAPPVLPDAAPIGEAPLPASATEKPSGADALPPPRERTPGEALIRLLVDHVDPEAWIDYGGSRARISERNGVVIVTAPPTTHRRFRAALDQLRRAYPSSLLIEAVMIEVARETFDRLDRRSGMSFSHAGHAGHGRSRLAFARELLAEGSATVRWRNSSVVALGEALTSTSSADGNSVSVELRPTLDVTSGVLSLGIRAERHCIRAAGDGLRAERDGDERKGASSEGRDDRTVSTTATIPLRDGAVVIELPASSAGETVCALVIVPTRR